MHVEFVTKAWVDDPLRAVLAKIPGYPRTPPPRPASAEVARLELAPTLRRQRCARKQSGVYSLPSREQGNIAMAQQDHVASAPIQKERSGPRLAPAIAATLVAVAIWAALRAYTGVFEVLNLRVFVGAIILVIPMIAAGALQGKGARWNVLQSVLGLTTVIGGEGIGSLLSGSPPVLDKFTLIYLGVALVLPWLKTK